MKRKPKVIILYRVVQEWRRPVFERLAQKLDLAVFHGPDFVGSKVVNSKKETIFRRKKLISFKLRKPSKNGLIAMPISPFLFFSLIKESPDVIITEGASNLFNALVGFIYCKIFGKKFIWWSLGKLTGTQHTGFRKKIDILVKHLEKNSNAIISYSSTGKKYFESVGALTENIFVAVNVVDTAAKKIELEKNKFDLVLKNKEDFTILSVGALTSYKRIDVLIKAFAKIQNQIPHARLLVVGDGPERKNLEDLAHKLGITKIEFTGKVFDGVYRYFTIADVFVMPGLGGLAVSEAMLYGVPVIASVGDGCEKDLISHGVDGLIDEKLNETSLATYLTELAENQKKLSAMQKAAAHKIETQYNIHTYLAKVLAAIQHVQNNKKYPEKRADVLSA